MFRFGKNLLIALAPGEGGNSSTRSEFITVQGSVDEVFRYSSNSTASSDLIFSKSLMSNESSKVATRFDVMSDRTKDVGRTPVTDSSKDRESVSMAEQHFDRADWLEANGDPAAEAEYKLAIAARNGRYPDAWQGLERVYQGQLRFSEAAVALQNYMVLAPRRRHDGLVEELKTLRQAAELQSRINNSQPPLLEDLLQFIPFVMGYGGPTQATAYGEMAVKLYPNSSKAYLMLARYLPPNQTEQKQRELTLIKRAIELDPNSSAAYGQLGWHYFSIGNNVEASNDAFKKALELSSGQNVDAWYGTAQVLAVQGKNKDAIEAYRNYLRLRKVPSQNDNYIKREIERLQKDGKDGNSSTRYKSGTEQLTPIGVSAKTSNSAKLSPRMSSKSSGITTGSAAVSVVTKESAQPKLIRRTLSIPKAVRTSKDEGGRIPEGRGTHVSEAAKKHLERALSSYSNDPLAEEEYRKAIKANGGFYPEAWSQVASYYANRFRFAEAVTAQQNYLAQVNPKEFDQTALEKLSVWDRASKLKALHDAGEQLSAEEAIDLTNLIDRFGVHGDALPYAENAVKLHPESSRALVTLAKLMGPQQRDRALELLNRAVTFQPYEPAVYVARAWCQYQNFGRYTDAETDFRRAIELSKGSSASAWVGLADTLNLLGQKQAAIDAYKKYLSIRPKEVAFHDGRVEEVIERLQNDGEVGNSSTQSKSIIDQGRPDVKSSKEVPNPTAAGSAAQPVSGPLKQPDSARPLDWVPVKFEVDGKEMHQRFKVLLYVNDQIIEPRLVDGGFIVPPELKSAKYAEVRFLSGPYDIFFGSVYPAKFSTDWTVGVDTKPFDPENVRDDTAKSTQIIYYINFESKLGDGTKLTVEARKPSLLTGRTPKK